MAARKMTWEEFATRYCETQEQTPEGLAELLCEKIKMFSPRGFFLGEAQIFGSSWFGQVVILPYGGKENTFKEVPDHPFTPRGLASDTSVAIGYIDAADVRA